MKLSRHQLHTSLRVLDDAMRTFRCQVPRRVDVQERWNDKGEFETGPYPEPTFTDKRVGAKVLKVRTNADPLPTPHGAAFITVDPTSGTVECAACAARKKA